jgi:hypothetical protein
MRLLLFGMAMTPPEMTFGCLYITNKAVTILTKQNSRCSRHGMCDAILTGMWKVGQGIRACCS